MISQEKTITTYEQYLDGHRLAYKVAQCSTASKKRAGLLTRFEKELYIFFASFTGPTQFKQEVLAEKFGVCREYVCRATKSLKMLGLIETKWTWGKILRVTVKPIADQLKAIANSPFSIVKNVIKEAKIKKWRQAKQSAKQPPERGSPDVNCSSLSDVNCSSQPIKENIKKEINSNELNKMGNFLKEMPFLKTAQQKTREVDQKRMLMIEQARLLGVNI